MKLLQSTRILSLGLNLPGPLAAAKLQQLGAAVVKVEPPSGDPLAQECPDWYNALHQDQEIITLDLKNTDARVQLVHRLAEAHLLITSMRPASLHRLRLDWTTLHATHRSLCHVAIVGSPHPHENLPGHDLNFQAAAGLLNPPHMPRTCVADLAGAERVVSVSLALLLARERGAEAQFAEVSLAEVANEFAAPGRYGLTTPDGILGGAHPGYNLYRASDGWISVAALEPHFWSALTRDLALNNPDRAKLQEVFLTRPADAWELWAREREIPITKVQP